MAPSLLTEPGQLQTPGLNSHHASMSTKDGRGISSPQTTPEKAKWTKLLRHCLQSRVQKNEFSEFLVLASRKFPLSSKDLVGVVLQCRDGTRISDDSHSAMVMDPLVPEYLDVLYCQRKITTRDLLLGLLRTSSISARPFTNGEKDQEDLHTEEGVEGEGDVSPKGRPEKRRKITSSPLRLGRTNTLLSDYRILQNLMVASTSGFPPPSTLDAADAFVALSKWVFAMLKWDSRQRPPLESSTGDEYPSRIKQDSNAKLLFEALGVLIAAFLTVDPGIDAIRRGSEELKQKLASTLASYIPLCGTFSFILRDRLEAVQKEFDLDAEASSSTEPKDLKAGIGTTRQQDFSVSEFEASVADEPVVYTRAGLYVYLNAMLDARPLVDDILLLNYLNNRYAGNQNMMVEELITAAFDVLANSRYRNDSPQILFVYKSFLVNKVPTFLADLQSVTAMQQQQPIPLETCIANSLARIDHTMFPSLSEMFSMSHSATASVLSDVRQEFLFSCALNHVIPEKSIERILGENPMQALPVGGLLNKNNLVQQILENSTDRFNELLNGLELLNGNVKPITIAISEAVCQLCSSKDIASLKNICNSLAKRPQCFDILLLFVQPRVLLRPLCELLNDSEIWGPKQEEKKFKYEEFGRILFFVLAFRYKFDLTLSDLGIRDHTSFIGRLVENRNSIPPKLDSISDRVNENLGIWIMALFVSEGINSETTGNCSPQEFYSLIPLIMDQMMVACKSGKLTYDILKGGIEYMLDPCLLPSLVITLTCLGDYLWKAPSDMTRPLLKIIGFLVNPPPLPDQSRLLHGTVLCVVSRHLVHAINAASSSSLSPTDKELVPPLMSALEPHLWFQRSVAVSPRYEFEKWVDRPLPVTSDGIVFSIRKMFSSLLHFGANASTDTAPASFTYRQIIHATQIAGTPRVLQGILDEVEVYSKTQLSGMAADLAVSLITAHVPETFTKDYFIVARLQLQQHQGESPDASVPAKTEEPPMPTSKSVLLTLRDALTLEYQSLSKSRTEANPKRSGIIVRLHRRVNALTALSPHIPLTFPDLLGSQETQSHGDNMGQISTNMIPDIALDDGNAGTITTTNTNNNHNHNNNSDINNYNSNNQTSAGESAADSNPLGFTMDNSTNFDDLMRELPADPGILDDIDKMF